MRHRIYPETEDLKLKRAVETCAYRFKLRLVQLLIQDVSDQIKHAEENNDHDRLENLLSEKIVLDKAKAELSSFFGTAII